jgi:hypothetical protein
MFLRIGIVSVMLALGAAASSARAQSSAGVHVRPVTLRAAPGQQPARPGVGPSVESGIAAAHRVAAAPLDVAPGDPGSPHVGRDEALMIVGGAAFIVGAIIGDKSGTVFMVGGGLVFLYGLFEFLQ